MQRLRLFLVTARYGAQKKLRAGCGLSDPSPAERRITSVRLARIASNADDAGNGGFSPINAISSEILRWGVSMADELSAPTERQRSGHPRSRK